MVFVGLLVVEAVAAAIAAKLGAEGISRLVAGGAGKATETVVVRYTGYGKGSRGKDDSALRQFLTQEIEQTRNGLRNVVDILNNKKEKPGAASAKGCIDELDLFFNDVRLVPTKRVAFLSDDNVKVDKDTIERIKDMDRQVVEKLSIVGETTKRMAQMMLDGQALQHEKEFGKMRLYLNDMRSLFKDRMVHISSMK